MNDNVPIDIGGSVRMDGGPTIHGIYPARRRGAYKRFGGFAPGWGAPAPHPLTSRPPPPPLALPLSLFHFFLLPTFLVGREVARLYTQQCLRAGVCSSCPPHWSLLNTSSVTDQ